MLDANFINRYSRLLEARTAERLRQFPSELRQISARAAQRGIFHSSVHASQVHQAHERELEVRAILAWESLARVQRTLGTQPDGTLRQDLKRQLSSQVNSFCAELSQSLQQQLQRLPRNQVLSLDAMRQHLIQKHDVEIDLYVDSLMNSPEQDSAQAQYNFYGSVGAVQTGANAQANVVQNLGADDRAALTESLTLIRDALQQASDLAETQRQELLEIAAECETQVVADSPNNTKLLTMLTILGTAVQSIASARPAYQALRTALFPLGITLP
ncbi:hypothetical protein [Pseudoxanthomonas suwonensis]|uniref:hypothetical protein n=1 Tax=Pseudoxanthomonas suwonensis TaxID=314722 RepID=UPI000AC5E29E|nr:hypothetical protein [Pseudoxanthomonas suwonensis]